MDRRLFACFVVLLPVVLFLVGIECDFAEARGGGRIGRSGGGLRGIGSAIAGLLGLLWWVFLPLVAATLGWNEGRSRYETQMGVPTLLGALVGFGCYFLCGNLTRSFFGPGSVWVALALAPLLAALVAYKICNRLGRI